MLTQDNRPNTRSCHSTHIPKKNIGTHYNLGRKAFYGSLFAVFLFIFTMSCSAGPLQPAEQRPTDQPKDKKPLIFTNTVLTLTFDDGDADNYEIRQDLLRNDIHATFYVVSSFIGKPGYMSETQLRTFYDDGNEIGGHSLDHINLTDLHGEDLNHEICQDRTNLISYGFEVVSFAYPFGSMTDEAKKTVEDCGYETARIVSGGPETFPVLDRYALRPMPYIVDDTRLPKMFRYIRQTQVDGGGWVIFTFHHVCDDCDYYSVSPSIFSDFTDWLGEQQKNGLVILTIQYVMKKPIP